MVRVVVLNRETGETFTEDIGEDNPVAIYVPGIHAHGYEALTDCLFCYFVTEEYDADDPDEHGCRGTTRAWAPVEHADPILSARDPRDRHRRGRAARDALLEAFPGARPDPHRLGRRSRRRRARGRLVLHAAAWTDVDGAEDDPQERGRRQRRRRAARGRLGAPLVLWSSDYVFDGSKREPYVESDAPARSARTAARSCTARRPPASRRGSCGARGSSAPPRRTSCARCCASAPSATRSPSSPTRSEAPPTSAISPRRRGDHRLPYGVYHVAAAGACSWADFAEAIFEEAGLATRVRRITTGGVRRPRPAPRLLGAAEREGRARAAALARGPARMRHASEPG